MANYFVLLKTKSIAFSNYKTVPYDLFLHRAGLMNFHFPIQMSHLNQEDCTGIFWYVDTFNISGLMCFRRRFQYWAVYRCGCRSTTAAGSDWFPGCLSNLQGIKEGAKVGSGSTPVIACITGN